MSSAINLVWFRQDLRIEDNPALSAAAAEGCPVLPLFVATKDDADPWPASEISRLRQREALSRLARELERLGSPLTVRQGKPRDVLAKLLSEHPVQRVYWNRRYEPYERGVEEAVGVQLREAGVEVRPSDGNLLFAPELLRNSAGKPYRVFTPFWRAVLQLASTLGREAPVERLVAPPKGSVEVGETLPPTGQRLRLSERLEEFLADYADLRDRPDHEGTSRLSASLHFGEIGARQLWNAVRSYERDSLDARRKGAGSFLRQLAWREFAHHLLFHFPETPHAPMRPQFERFPWRDDEAALDAWKRGRTGYPIVDAGMRQLAKTGWMHNRVRLIVSSFLVKHLLIDWRQGARYFWETLEDADLANNTLGWQWIAGCGADAAPYFRIFNPILQGQRFDPQGKYVREWVPEMAGVEDRWVHRPWEAPDRSLLDSARAPVREYPRPMIDHHEARERALEALQWTKTP